MPTSTLSIERSRGRLTASIGVGTFFGTVANVAQLGTRLVTVPLIIRFLGLDGYGIWSIIMVTAAYMRFGNSGLKSAFQKYVAEATETGRFADANRLLSTGAIAVLALSAAALIPVALCARGVATAAGVPPRFLGAVSTSTVVLAGVYLVCNSGAVYESIVNGGHRVDLTKKCGTILTILEAIAIVALLWRGYGLLAMTLVMAISPLLYTGACYFAARTVVPDIRVRFGDFRLNAFPELIRFAGSYQLVSLLELVYTAAGPVVILRLFGATAAGVYAVVTRAVAAVLCVQDALILPILSGASAVFASGRQDRIRAFLANASRATLAAALPALAFLCVFGSQLIFAWTGQAGGAFRTALWLVACAGLFKVVSLLQLVLYRASGRALFDVIRQLLRIFVLFCAAGLAWRVGFHGLLVGMLCAELIGVVFMSSVMAATFRAFSLRIIAYDGLRVLGATLLMVGCGTIARVAASPWAPDGRLGAAFQLGAASLGWLVAVWPALVVTRSVDVAERRIVGDAFAVFRTKVAPGN